MIISIITERITDNLKKVGSIALENFGEFRLEKRKAGSTALGSESTKNHIVFTPDKHFLDIINN